MAAVPLILCLRAAVNALATRPVLSSYARLPNNAAPVGDQRVAPNRPAILKIFRDRDGANGALVGTVSVWGANLGNPDMGSANTQVFKGDGVATNYDSTIPYVAFLNYNWIPIIFRADLIAKTGTLSSTIGTPAIVGAGGSIFTTEFMPGMTIKFNGEVHVVQEVTDDTHLTLEDNAAATVAGATLTGSTFPCQLLTTDFTIANNGGNGRLTLAAAAQAPLGSRIELHFVVPKQIVADGAHPYENVGIRAMTAMWALFGANAANSKTTISVEGAGQ